MHRFVFVIIVRDFFKNKQKRKILIEIFFVNSSFRLGKKLLKLAKPGKNWIVPRVCVASRNHLSKWIRPRGLIMKTHSTLTKAAASLKLRTLGKNLLMKLAEQTLDCGAFHFPGCVLRRENISPSSPHSLETHPAHTQSIPLCFGGGRATRQSNNKTSTRLGNLSAHQRWMPCNQAALKLLSLCVCASALCFECICKVESCQPNGAALF